MEKINCILPKQYVGKYKNDEGVVLYPVIFIDEDALEIVKIFIPKITYQSLEIKKFLGNYVEIEVEEDEEGRTEIKLIKKIDK